MSSTKTTNPNEIEINKEIYILKSSLPKVSKLAATNKKKMPLVMIRSYASGVHFGYLKSKKLAGERYIVTLEESRRVYSWAGACSLSQLATEGTKQPDSCKIAVPVPTMEIMEVIEIIPLTTEAEANLKGVTAWKS
jgi:hypothetical protein